MLAWINKHVPAEAATGRRASAWEGSFRHVGRTTILLALVWTCLVAPSHGQGPASPGVTYSLSPVLTGTNWNDGLGLDDAFLYGGKLGVEFGPWLGVDAFYLTSGWIGTDWSTLDLRDSAGAVVADQRLKVRRIGGALTLRWPSDRVAPFVTAGGGVIRWDPESGPTVEQIDVKLGGGLDYIINRRLRTRAWIQWSRFRLDRYVLAPGGVESGLYPIDPEEDKIRNNVSLGVSLDYALGRSRFGRAARDGRLHPFSAVEIEPLLGRLYFDDARLGATTLAGARFGGELNPWVGWGLYYWRAMESDLSDTRPLQSYGGEARFGLASKLGPQPYVTIGVGQIDFRSGFTDSEGTGRDDRTALILGAGIRAALFRGLDLNVSVRDLMYGEERLDRLSGADDISHNWLVSGALVFGIGGRGGSVERPPSGPKPVHQVEALSESKADSSKGSVKPARPEKRMGETETALPTEAVSGYVSGKNVVIPVPLEGEIYIRYGRTSRDMGDTVLRGTVQSTDSIQFVPMPEARPADIDTALSKESPSGPARPDTVTQAATTTDTAGFEPVTRKEFDSLLTSLKADLAAMWATPDEGERSQVTEVVPDTATAIENDSLIAVLQDRLSASEMERRRLDSLLQIQTQTARMDPDSLATLQDRLSVSERERQRLDSLLRIETPTTPKDPDSLAVLQARLSASEGERQRLDSLLRSDTQDAPVEPDSLVERRMQQKIAEQVAAALAAKEADAPREITQADLQNMMAVLTDRMDSVSAQGSSADLARLREQLELEAVRQTKSQEEFQRAMEDYVRRYGEMQESRSDPPAIVVTQPSPAPLVVEREGPSTIVIQPDTQYVVIQDTAGREVTLSSETQGEDPGPAREKGFIDLRPTGYTGWSLESPKQFVLGGRLDIGPITTRQPRLRWVPELALGLGGGAVSVMAVMNAEYGIAEWETGSSRLSPYVRMGFGVLGFGGDHAGRDTEGVLNFTYGLSVDSGPTGFLRGLGHPVLFVEHQIIDLFDLHRLALGLQWLP